MKTNPATEHAAHHSFWPWAILGWFALVITFMATFITWAVQQNMDLVRADYYEEEMRFQQQLDRANRARARAPETRVAFDFAAQQILIALPPGQAEAAVGRVHLYRPSDAKLDRDLPLKLNPAGQQALDASELSPGLWKVRVRWTAGEEEYFFEQPVTIGH